MADSKADAPFVFEGSVKSLAASNVSRVPADSRTVVVEVDHVRHAPRALAGFAGKEVTVRLAPNEKVAAGERATFFTDGLVYGEQLAVQSRGHDPVVHVEAKAALAGASPVVQKLRRRVDQAQAVISGEVAAIRPVAAPAKKAMAAGGPAAAGPLISEHAPFWNEAVINVSSVHKGPKQKKVTVRFPTSTDVKWRKAPRFKKGQKGTWLLHSGVPAPTGVKTAAVKAAAAAPPAGFYTALDPDDFHATGDAPVVQAMLPAAAAPVTAAARKTARKAAAKPRSRKRR